LTFARFVEDGFAGYTAGFGLLFEGGFRVCPLGSWNCQTVVEYAFHNFGDADVTYNQLGGGIRFYRRFTPRVRGFGQFVLAWQNDGDEETIGFGIGIPLGNPSATHTPSTAGGRTLWVRPFSFGGSQKIW
jgi:hypothetical protein